MKLLRASVQDALQLAGLNERMIKASGHDAGLDRQGLLCRMRDWLAAGEYRAHFIVNEGLFIGYALSKVDVAPAVLRQFFIEPEYRRQGLGTQAVRLLLHEIFGRCHAVQLDVHPTNAAALAFWRSIGFEGTPEKMLYSRVHKV